MQVKLSKVGLISGLSGLESRDNGYAFDLELREVYRGKKKKEKNREKIKNTTIFQVNLYENEGYYLEKNGDHLL